MMFVLKDGILSIPFVPRFSGLGNITNITSDEDRGRVVIVVGHPNSARSLKGLATLDLDHARWNDIHGPLSKVDGCFIIELGELHFVQVMHDNHGQPERLVSFKVPPLHCNETYSHLPLQCALAEDYNGSGAVQLAVWQATGVIPPVLEIDIKAGRNIVLPRLRIRRHRRTDAGLLEVPEIQGLDGKNARIV